MEISSLNGPSPISLFVDSSLESLITKRAAYLGQHPGLAPPGQELFDGLHPFLAKITGLVVDVEADMARDHILSHLLTMGVNIF